MRIAFVLDQFPVLSQTFVLSQITGLIERGHEVAIYADRAPARVDKTHSDVSRFELARRTTYGQAIPHALVPRLRSAVSRLVRWGWRHPLVAIDTLNVARYGRRALSLRVLHETFPARGSPEDYDVIHAHFGPNGVRALALRRGGSIRGPIITTFHGADVNRLPRLWGADMYRRLFARGALFTVGSEFMRRRVAALGAPEARIVTLPMGVDLTRLRFAERTLPRDGELRLLTIARLVEAKGVEHALRAVAIARRELPQLRYTIAGAGPLRESLEARARELGLERIVEFLGAVTQDEARSLYGRAHLFVLPSVVASSGDEEGQAVVLCEAQACGLPVVATAVGGVAESIVPDRSGLLVRQRDPEAMAAAIIELAVRSDEWSAMGRIGRRHVEQRFDLEALNDGLVEIYRQVGAAPPY